MQNNLPQLLSEQIKLRDEIIKRQEIDIIKLQDKIKGHKNAKILLLSLFSISIVANILLLLK